MPREPDDQRHLEAAQGYCDLGMYLDADAELDEINADVRHLPAVLMVRAEIYKCLEKWALMQVVCKKLAWFHDDPHWFVSWAYATRRAESIDSAKLILLEAVKKHPKAAVIYYNLACYESQRGGIEAAKKYLDKTFRLDPKLRLRALDDDDLMPLWMLIGDD